MSLKIKSLLLLLIGTIACISCNNNNEDDGYRGFMSKATIVGDSIGGYFCYLNGGGLVTSHSKELEGTERGYFSFNYMEDDWKSSDGNLMYISDAYVRPELTYSVISPINIVKAEGMHITDKDSCTTPPLFILERGFKGYFDFNTGISISNIYDLKEYPAEMHIVYDSAKQTPDTLRLQFYYNQKNPNQWTETHINYGTTSCDISSLATLEQWSDSVTIILEAGDKYDDHRTKISKEDFLKPTNIYTK